MSRTRGILLAGVGGQGVVLASHIAAGALQRAGYDVKQSEVHGMSQRGGVVTSHLRFGARVASPLISRGDADAVVAFEWAEALRWVDWLRPGGVLVADPRSMPPPLASSDRRSWSSAYPAVGRAPLPSGFDVRFVDATGLAAAEGTEKAAGTVLLGVLANLLEVPEKAWRETIEESVPLRTKEANLRAFGVGRRLVFPPSHLPPDPMPPAEVARYESRLEIVPEWCKGCEICVRFCPEHILSLDGGRKVVVTDPGACTGCRLCEMLCPDFAIAVRREAALA